MSADITSRLLAQANCASPPEDDLLREAAAEIVRLRGEVGREAINVPAAKALITAIGPGYRVIYRSAFRWLDSADEALPNHYAMFSATSLAKDHGHDLVLDLGFAAILRDESIAPAEAKGDAICRVCDGGPGNEGVCLCGAREYTPHPSAAQVQPVCPATDCGAQVLYECPACSHHNYPPRDAAHHSACKLGAVVAEYVIARDTYEAMTNVLNSHALPRRLPHHDPILLRYRSARLALNEAALQHRGDSRGGEVA